MSIEQLFNIDIEIQQLTHSDSWGESDTWATSSTVKGLHNPGRGSRQFNYDKQVYYFLDRFYISSGATVTNRDRLKVGDDIYKIVSVRQPIGAAHLEIDAEIYA